MWHADQFVAVSNSGWTQPVTSIAVTVTNAPHTRSRCAWAYWANPSVAEHGAFAHVFRFGANKGDVLEVGYTGRKVAGWVSAPVGVGPSSHEPGVRHVVLQ